MKNTILLLSSIHCNITLMFPFVCNICNAISYATSIRSLRQVSFPPRRQAKISGNTNLIAHLQFAVTPSNVFASCYDIAWLGSRSNSNIRNSDCVDGLYECVSSRGWDIEHCSITPPLLRCRPQMGTESQSRCRSRSTNLRHGDEISRFSYPTFRTVI